MSRTRTALAIALAALGILAAPAAAADGTWDALGAVGPPDPSPAGFDLKRVGGAPMVAYAHWNGSNHEIRVMRHTDPGLSRPNGWEQVGTQVNADPAHEAYGPSLAAGPGNVPWVSWIEKDGDGIAQIRAARYSAAKDRFVEPVGGDWPIQSRPRDGYEPKYFYGANTQLVFVGSRAHIFYRSETPAEYVIGIKRLAADRRSWRRIGAPRRFAPASFRGSVLDGVVHTTFNSRLGGAGHVDRLGPNGWEQAGGYISEAAPPDAYDIGVSGIAALNGIPHAGVNAGGAGLVARLVNGHWQDVGGGLDGDDAGDLRLIGGRLWVAGLGDDELRLFHLADDAGAWNPSPAFQAERGAVLTGIDGVPHVGWIHADGRVVVSRLDGVEPAGPDDNDGSSPPCPTSDGEIDAPVIAPPLPAAWPPADPNDTADTSCERLAQTPPTGGGGTGGEAPAPGPADPSPTVPSGPPPAPTGGCGARTLGTPAADRLFGDALRNEIAGRSGNDTIFGLGGDDCLSGNAGNDVLKGGAGADRLSGDSGHDRLVSGPGNDTVSAGPGNDLVDSRGAGFDVIDCGPGRDRALVGDLDRVRNCERVVNAD